jgi:hypothetical protein
VKRSGALLGNLPLSVVEMFMLRTLVNDPPPFRMSVTSATIEALLPFTSRHVTRPVTTALGSKSVLVNLTVPWGSVPLKLLLALNVHYWSPWLTVPRA